MVLERTSLSLFDLFPVDVTDPSSLTIYSQGDGVTPVDPVCSQQLETSGYYCGIAGTLRCSPLTCSSLRC